MKRMTTRLSNGLKVRGIGVKRSTRESENGKDTTTTIGVRKGSHAPSSTPGRDRRKQVNYRASVRAMGTEVSFWLRADRGEEAAIRLLEEAVARFIRYEKTFSRFDPESELCALNRCAGRPARVGRDMFALLTAASRHRITTGGLFDPTLLGALEAAGYDRDFSRLNQSDPPTVVPYEENEPPAPLPGAPENRTFDLHRTVRGVHLSPGTRLDLGGIAKGWSVDRVAEWLGTYGDVLVDAGGDVRAVGNYPWRLGVALPEGGLQPRPITLRTGAIATSSVLKRSWKSGGSPQHHLIHPRTGRPVDAEVAQATVVAETAEEAEVWAKVIILGGGEAISKLKEQGSLAALWVTKRGQVCRTPDWPGDDGRDRDQIIS